MYAALQLAARDKTKTEVRDHLKKMAEEIRTMRVEGTARKQARKVRGQSKRAAAAVKKAAKEAAVAAKKKK